MEGAVDTHVHSAPDPVERKLDYFDVARQARDRRMAAVVRYPSLTGGHLDVCSAVINRRTCPASPSA
jgi:uncharacterized protein DUF6282